MALTKVDSEMKKEEAKSEEPQAAAEAQIPEDQQLANYAYSMQLAGEEKMNKFAFKEACDYMITAAENYIKVSRTSKNQQLVAAVKSKLPPLLDRVSLVVTQ